MRMFTYAFLCSMGMIMAGCSSLPGASPKPPNQELIVNEKVQPMGRSEVIDAVKQCETSGLRAIPLYAKRKIGGYSVETVVEVTCGPKYIF